MYDTSKLKGKIIEVFGTQGAFANKVNRSPAFISGVLNGKNYLEQRDIDTWAELLGITGEELTMYFFTKKVHEREQKDIED